MNSKYFSFILLLLTPHISQTMHAHLSTIIKFNGKKKSLYEWIQNDHDKEFGHTPIINMFSKVGYEPNDHYSKQNSVNSITPEQINNISAGLYIYCKDLETKTINSKKIKYGALALAFNPSELKKTSINVDKAVFYSKTDDIAKVIMLQSNLPQADYLKKYFEKTKKLDQKNEKHITI